MKISTTQKLTRRLQVQRTPKEVYIRDDIPCNLEGCRYCPGTQELTLSEDKQLFILDTELVLTSLEIIEQFNLIQNMVITQTTLKASKQKSLKHNSQLRNLIDSNYSKNCIIYPDEFSVSTQGGDPFLLLTQYYTDHCKKVLELFRAQFVSDQINVILLTANFQRYQTGQQLGLQVFTLHEYIKKFGQGQVDLMDYIGYQEMDEEVKQQQVFLPHKSIQDCVQLLKQGLMFEGKLSVDRNDSSLAKIFVRRLGFEITIVDQNRSMHGDRVVVQLLPEQDWKSNKQQCFTSEETNDDFPTKEESATDGLNDVEKLQDLYKLVTTNGLIPKGKVIGILERIERNFCGHVEPLEDKYQFYPADGRYPSFYLKSSQQLLKKKIVVSFVDWPEWSQQPYCRLNKILGDSDDMFVEGNVILLEHQVETREFSRQVLACLPAEGDQWTIPQEEISKRLDLRSYPIVSIDPIGCRDIDDALHCRELPDGTFEVGVHIADVSHFVRPDTAMDLEAANRCTTVYLVDRRTDMLPKLLTENLCSLVSKVDHLAFSAMWTMDKNANILKTTFAKSVIRSQASLHYEQAQKMIDDTNDNSEITNSIRQLNNLAKKLKHIRVCAGALTLASNQVKFTFDAETHNPTDVRMYSMYETNSLVEEFMLLANVSVAEKILNRFPAISILRRHQEPKPKQTKELQDLLNKLGYKFDFNTSKELGDSLDQIERQNDPFFNKLIRILTTRCMNEALYICTADLDFPELYHYGLASQLYTHFTSPIRRYADILVHRLLTAAIDLESLPTQMSNKIKMSRLCDKMNMRHRNARFASRASSDYNTFLFFKNRALQGFNKEIAVITGIQSKGFGVILPQYGLEGFIEFKADDKQDNDNLAIIVNGKVHKIFDYIFVSIEVHLKHFHKQVVLTYLGAKN